MKDPAIDLPDVMERVQDDRELLFELFDIFQDDFANKRKTLDTLVSQQRHQDVRDLVHSLKGAAGNISAKMIFATCLRMEKNADNGDLSGIHEDMALLDIQYADFKEFVARVKANPKQYFSS